jgi:hypothetical protein
MEAQIPSAKAHAEVETLSPVPSTVTSLSPGGNSAADNNDVNNNNNKSSNNDNNIQVDDDEDCISPQ